MELSVSFTKLWKNASFRKRLQTIVIDEMHCVDEWGEEFRPQYRELSRLPHYTGQNVPFIAWTATCTRRLSLSDSHLDLVTAGIDVGCERPNLLFLTRVLEKLIALSSLLTHPASIIYRSQIRRSSVSSPTGPERRTCITSNRKYKY
jgi:superfamily II DNA helicase RecQ